MTELRSKSFIKVADLAVDEGVGRVCFDGTKRYWHLWAHVLDKNGQPMTFCVPVAPNGDFNEKGPGGRTWGLKRSGLGRWQIAPSINVLESSPPRVGRHQDTLALKKGLESCITGK